MYLMRFLCSIFLFSMLLVIWKNSFFSIEFIIFLAKDSTTQTNTYLIPNRYVPDKIFLNPDLALLLVFFTNIK